MDVNIPNGTYILVIDTNAYSGNFERQLCGYMTGYHDCDRGHGDHEAEFYLEAETARIFDKVTQVPHNEYGWVGNAIRTTPGRLNNGSGFHYDVGSDAHYAAARATASMEAYFTPLIIQAQSRIDSGDYGQPRLGWTREACERAIEGYRVAIENAGKFVSSPAYESVAIFLSEPLTRDEMEIVTRRAHEYAAAPKKYSRTGQPFEVRDVYMVHYADGVETRMNLKDYLR